MAILQHLPCLGLAAGVVLVVSSSQSNQTGNCVTTCACLLQAVLHSWSSTGEANGKAAVVSVTTRRGGDCCSSSLGLGACTSRRSGCTSATKAIWESLLREPAIDAELGGAPGETMMELAVNVHRFWQNVFVCVVSCGLILLYFGCALRAAVVAAGGGDLDVSSEVDRNLDFDVIVGGEEEQQQPSELDASTFIQGTEEQWTSLLDMEG